MDCKLFLEDDCLSVRVPQPGEVAPLLPDNHSGVAWLAAHWPQLWPLAEAQFWEDIADYEYGHTFEELMAEPKNYLSASVSNDSPPGHCHWFLQLTIAFPHGAHYFVVEFEDDTIVHSQGVF